MPISTTTTTTENLVLKLRPAARASPEYINDLKTQGFSVVKSVLSDDQAESYITRAYDWLESHGTGFDRNDRSTWSTDKLPPHAKGGMYSVSGVAHEQFLWDLRAEPAILAIFSEIWGTDQLLASFDGINMAVPANEEDLKAGAGTPWPHVDQSPLKRDLQCIQGIINLTPNGDLDGGLQVLVGSNRLYSDFFDAHEHEKPEGGWPTKDVYLHTESQLQWFFDRGCYWKKVNADPGDLLVWDSRCVHYGARATGTQNRVAGYICYKPASLITPELLTTKQKAFNDGLGTSHDPVQFQVNTIRPEHSAFRTKPAKQAILSDTQKRLAGLLAYE